MAQPKRLDGISYDQLAAYVVTAVEENADFKAMVEKWKQKTGFEFSQLHGRRLWQKGYWDRVLRDGDNPLSVCRYLIENPVRARLVTHPREYALCGSMQYTIDEICQAVQMKGWWSPF